MHDEILKAFDDLVRIGKVLYIGVSNWTAAQISEGLRVCDHYKLERIVANQPSYNMFDRFIEKESIPFCEKNGIGQVVFAPLAQGILTGKYKRGMGYPEGSRASDPRNLADVTVWDYLHEDLLEQVERLMKIAGEMGVSLPQLAMAWVLRQPNVSSALMGATRVSQLEDNLKVTEINLTDEILSRIEAILKSGSYTIKHNIIT